VVYKNGLRRDHCERQTPCAARGHPVVISCLPTSREVESILHGPDGLLAGLGKGSTLVDCTSGDPASSRRIAALLSEHGVRFLDAPVSGGVVGAEKGALTIMVGGDESTLFDVIEVLQTFGKKIVLAGYSEARRILNDQGDALMRIADALLEREVLDLEEVKLLVKGLPLPSRDESRTATGPTPPPTLVEPGRAAPGGLPEPNQPA